ncbi:hypothetical protein D3C78_1953070 [compost metagenome]
MTPEEEDAEIDRILRETQELEAKRRAENAEFQEFLRTRKGGSSQSPKGKGDA